MNYSRVYAELIENAKIREQPKCYYEMHHIIPRHMSGTNENSNIVKLTGREHYIAHWLLYKIHGDHKSAFAWQCMSSKGNSGKRYSSRTFEYAKRAWSKHMKEFNAKRITSDETRKKMSDAKKGATPWNKGLIFPMPARCIIAREMYNKKPEVCKQCKSPLSFEKRKNTYCGNRCAHLDPENPTRVASKKPHIKGSREYRFKEGHVVPDDVKAKISKKLKGFKRPVIECPHCGKVGADGLMKRWHFDNCKLKGEIKK